ncbi:MAG: hypothetical protein GF353_24445 [Candidatus Lokiarchaeota archaeon]|nr:hypothetical protein [Candidatus Lokiarchaeota archaeon]
MPLELLQIISGIGIIVFIVIALFIGLLIILAYFEFKESILLYIGLTWIALILPYVPSAINFIMYILSGAILPDRVCFIIGLSFSPVGFTCWIAAITELMYPRLKKSIIIISIIYGLAFELVFFYYVIVNPSIIGMVISPVDIEYRTFVVVYIIIDLGILLITGVKLGLGSMKNENEEAKLKGKLHIIAWILYVGGALFDGILPLTLVTILIVRIILILSSIAFYGSFLLPNWMRSIFIRKKFVDYL